MSRWGDSGSFDGVDATVKILPHVETGKVWHAAEEPIRGTIDELMLLDVRGDQRAADKLLADARSRYLGRPYSEWISNG